jgi:hypothetical protein
MSWAFGKSPTILNFVTVFHRILDFKNGAGFLSWSLFYCPEGREKKLLIKRAFDLPTTAVNASSDCSFTFFTDRKAFNNSWAV